MILARFFARIDTFRVWRVIRDAVEWHDDDIMRTRKTRTTLRIHRFEFHSNKENVSAVLRISRNCKTQLLKNYEDALHWLRIRKSAIRDEQMSRVYHEEKTHLQMCESTSEWWVYYDGFSIMFLGDNFIRKRERERDKCEENLKFINL